MGKILNRVVTGAVVGGLGLLGYDHIMDKGAKVDAFNPTIVKTADQIALYPEKGVNWGGYMATRVTLPQEGKNTPDALLGDTYGETGVLFSSVNPHVRAAVACSALRLNGIDVPTEGIQNYQAGLKTPASYEGDKLFGAAESACLETLAASIASLQQPTEFKVIVGLANNG